MTLALFLIPKDWKDMMQRTETPDDKAVKIATLASSALPDGADKRKLDQLRYDLQKFSQINQRTQFCSTVDSAKRLVRLRDEIYSTLESIPRSAYRGANLQAVTQFGATSQNGNKPVKIVARTGGEAIQGFWGRCVHDMSGFIPPKGSIPLDYEHDDTGAIGFSDSVAVVDGQLIAIGQLTPFRSDDTASEVISKASQGVPYQASIRLDPATIEAVEVPEGRSVQVNGITFNGPGTVFTKWGVTGIAICLYGADANTSVEFSRKQQRNKDTLTERVAAAFRSKT